MQQVTIGPKYQIVIPKSVRKSIKGLIPGSKVMVQKKSRNTLTIKKIEKSWMERTSGITKEAWKGINTTKYLEDLRNEWEQKV